MESVKIQRKIDWQKVFGVSPKIKNCKIIIFGDNSEEMTITRFLKIKIGDNEYILNNYVSRESEEITIKSNRAEVLLELEYNKKTSEGKKKINYNFTEVITYFLVEFFGDRLKDDQAFQAIKECLKEYEEISI